MTASGDPISRIARTIAIPSPKTALEHDGAKINDLQAEAAERVAHRPA
jgi:hypothetical protein